MSVRFEFFAPNGKRYTMVVTAYEAEKPMKITGTGFGDCIPPEPCEFEWHIEGVDDNESLLNEEQALRLFEHHTAHSSSN